MSDLSRLIHDVARAIDPGAWAVMDSYLASTKKKYQGQDVGWPEDQFWHKESMAKACAALLVALPRLREEAIEAGNSGCQNCMMPAIAIRKHFTQIEAELRSEKL